MVAEFSGTSLTWYLDDGIVLSDTTAISTVVHSVKDRAQDQGFALQPRMHHVKWRVGEED